MTGNDWMERDLRARRNGRYIGYIVLAALAIVIFAGIAVMAVLAELGDVHDSSYPKGAKTIVLGLVALAVCVLAAAVSVHSEHRLRGFPSGRLASQISNASTNVQSRLGVGAYSKYAAFTGYGRYGRYRRHGPTSTLIAGIFFIGVGLFFAWGTVTAHADAGKSSYTQQNGTADTATVGTVNMHQDQGRYSTTYWATVDAVLRTPVGGHTATVVYIPNNVTYQSSQQISILVDPADPGYSELPGDPYTTGGTVAAFIAMVVIGLAIGVSSVVASFRMRARFRRLIQAGTGQAGTGQPATATGSASTAIAANQRYVHGLGSGAGPEAPGRHRSP